MVILFEFLAAALFFFSFLRKHNTRTVLSVIILAMFCLLVLPNSGQFSYSTVSIMDALIADSFSFWFSYLVLVVILSSVLVVTVYSDYIVTLSFFFLFVTCYLVFNSSDMLTLYLAYEFSLVPILIIVVKGGTYPDRSLRAIYMFVYTAFFSFPFMVYVV